MIVACNQCTKLHSKKVQLIFFYGRSTSQDGVQHSKHHCGGCCPPFRSAAPVVVSLPYDDILDPSPSWLHPLLHVPRRWLGWSTVNQGLVATPGFDAICSLTDSPVLLVSWVGWLSCCRMIYNHRRDLQYQKVVLTPDGYSHVRSPE